MLFSTRQLFQALIHAGQAAEGGSTPLIKNNWSYLWYAMKAYSGKELLSEASNRLERTLADSFFFSLQEFSQERVQARTVLAVAVAYGLASRLPYGGSDPPIVQGLPDVS